MTDYSYQLYSSRNFPPLENTLKMLASLGYARVEGYGGLVDSGAGLDAKQLKKQLDDFGLSMPTCHIGIEQLEQSEKEVFSLANTLGIEKIFVPAIAENERTTDANDWKSLAARLQKLHQTYSKEGISVGWHNHAFEFNATDSGELPLDILMQNAPDIELEFDLGWAVIGKQDPLNLLNKYGTRIVAAHIKDVAATGECSDEDGWADVGHGTMDWQALHTELAKQGVQHFVMEHDNPIDHQRFATRSIKFCKTL